MSTVYGIGVGPGDPGLMTVKARDILVRVDTVFAPTGESRRGSLAAEIAIQAGVEPSRVTPLVFPMTRQGDQLDEAWDNAAAQVAAAARREADAAFVTLGDPAVYSTWTYLRGALRRIDPAVSVATVPGIMAMNAAASTLGTALVEGDERLALLPLPEPVEALDPYLRLFETLVIYKIGARLAPLRSWVEARGLAGRSQLVVGAGLVREWAGTFTAIPPGIEGYLSLAFIRTGGGR